MCFWRRGGKEKGGEGGARRRRRGWRAFYTVQALTMLNFLYVFPGEVGSGKVGLYFSKCRGHGGA